MRKLGMVSFALSAALLSGCSSAEHAPKPTPPNGTLEQVTNNLGYAKTLGKLALKQEFDFTTTDGSHVYVYDFSKQGIDRQQFTSVVSHFASLAIEQPGPTETLTIYPEGSQKPRTVDAFAASRDLSEHDFVIVPPGTDMPEVFKDYLGNAPDAATTYFNDQAISVVRYPGENAAVDNISERDGLDVEACQSELLVFAIDPDPNANTELEDHLGQETWCNRDGLAMADALDGIPYDDYAQATGSISATVSTMYHTYKIDTSPIALGEYTALAAVA